MSTTVYVVVPPSPLFAAHWSFFLPDALPYDEVSRRQEESNLGRRIHVSGDRYGGFNLEIIRDYDIHKHRSVGSRKYAIGTLTSGQEADSLGDRDPSVKHPEKDEEDGGGYVDNNPVDDFETVCLEIEAPGPSLNSASQSTGGKRVKTEVKDCQWWVRQVVQDLVSRNLLEPQEGIDPSEAVAKLPVH